MPLPKSGLDSSCHERIAGGSSLGRARLKGASDGRTFPRGFRRDGRLTGRIANVRPPFWSGTTRSPARVPVPMVGASCRGGIHPSSQCMKPRKVIAANGSDGVAWFKLLKAEMDSMRFTPSHTSSLQFDPAAVPAQARVLEEVDRKASGARVLGERSTCAQGSEGRVLGEISSCAQGRMPVYSGKEGRVLKEIRRRFVSDFSTLCAANQENLVRTKEQFENFFDLLGNGDA